MRCEKPSKAERSLCYLKVKGNEKVFTVTWYEYSHHNCVSYPLSALCLCLQCVHVVSDEMWAASSPGPGPRLTTQHCLSLPQAGSAVRRPASAAVTETCLLLVSRSRHGPLIGQCNSSLASEWLILIQNNSFVEAWLNIKWFCSNEVKKIQYNGKRSIQ